MHIQGFTVGSDQFPILDHSHDHGGQGLPSSSMSQTDFSLLNDDLFTRRLIEAVRWGASWLYITLVSFPFQMSAMPLRFEPRTLWE